MSPIQTFEIALDIRAGRIPVRWSVRDHHKPEVRDSSGKVLWKGEIERVFWPQVEQSKWGNAEVVEIESPLDLRAQLFRAVNTGWNEKSALAFLESVGAWRISLNENLESWAKGTYARIEFLHRRESNVRVEPVTVKEVREEAEYWYRLLRFLDDPLKLKRAYRPPPPADARVSDGIVFAADTRLKNTLSVSLEWVGRDPRAVVEPITATELLAAAAWADVASHTGTQVCEHCMTRFASSRKKKYCRWECGHVVAVRNHKRKLAREKKARKEAL